MFVKWPRTYSRTVISSLFFKTGTRGEGGRHLGGHHPCDEPQQKQHGEVSCRKALYLFVWFLLLGLPFGRTSCCRRGDICLVLTRRFSHKCTYVRFHIITRFKNDEKKTSPAASTIALSSSPAPPSTGSILQACCPAQ